MVSETCSKLAGGLENGSGKKAVKYSVAFDGILPGLFKTFSSAQYGSEDKALPKVIREHAFKEDGRLSIYVIDRGLQSSRNMQSFCNERIVFIVRAKENQKYVELESMIDAQSEIDLGNLVLLKDSKVYLYAKNRYKTKNGKTYNKMEVAEEPLRLIIACDKEDNEKQYWFITNEFTISPKEVADTYRRRWDIEVFFRFLKQELNLSHLVSMNKNGIEVMLYMTLIVAMLVLIYKHGNNIGYKTAKRRLVMEFRDLIIALIVIECGGNPNIFFKT